MLCDADAAAADAAPAVAAHRPVTANAAQATPNVVEVMQKHVKLSPIGVTPPRG